MQRLAPAGLLLSGSLLAQVSAPHANTQTELAAARSFFAQQRLPQAEQILRDVLKRIPKDFTANEMLGIVLLAGGRDDEATPFLECAVQTNPRSVPAHENLAANYAKLNQTVLLERELKAVVALASRSFAAHHALGEFYAVKGNLPAAVVSLKEAAEINPRDYANRYDLALAEIGDAKLDSAEQEIRTLLRTNDNAELHSLLGEVLEKQREFLLAAQEYQQAVKLNPTEDAIFSWGTELVRHSNLKEALEVFQDGLGRYPNSWRLSIGSGITEFLLGHGEAAALRLLRATDLQPENSQDYRFLSLIDPVPTSQAVAMAQHFQKYASEHPTVAEAQLYYASFLLKGGLPDGSDSAEAKQVEALLQMAVRLDPSLAEAHLQLGILASRRDDYPTGASEFEAAIRYKPALALAHYRYSQALSHLGQRERSRHEMEEFRRLKEAQSLPDVVESFLLVGKGTL